MATFLARAFCIPKAKSFSFLIDGIHFSECRLFFALLHEVIFMNRKEFPEAIEMEKQLLSAMFMKDGLVVPEVASIINADDLYRPEHRLVFQAILRLYAKKTTYRLSCR